ncbi:MAG: FHA domain-containing protein [Myxococcota bacterium]
MFKLVISDDEGKTTVVPLVRDEITIGRAEGNTIRLTERNVSRQHAVLRKTDDGFEVADQGSHNGTMVDGHRIEGSAPIQAGGELRIGDYQIALHVDSSEVPAEGDSSTTPAEPSIPPPRLVMLSAPVPGAEFALSGDHMRLGRSEDLEVWVNHRSVSREHAEIVREEDGTFRIADLGSANGIQVNGEEVDETSLEPYDVVKLGRVRLRYVPEGEGYVFDPEAEAPDEDDEDPEAPSSSRAPLWVALGIVAVAVLAGGIIVSYAGDTPAAEAARQNDGDGEPEGSVDGPPTEGADEEPTANDEPAGADPEESLAACEEALKDSRFEDAVDHARAALQADPADVEAAECRSKGEAGVAFKRGFEAFEEGDIDGAFEAYADIPGDDPFREHPSFDEVTMSFAKHHVNRARELLKDEPEQAREHAEKVLDMPSPPRVQRRVATKLERAATRLIERGAGGGEQAPSPSAEADPDPDPSERALECAQKGDNACVVSALEGRAKTARDLALLIETYRTMGETEAATRNMELFVQRFPDDDRSSRYREFLEDRP